jgi:hypothetical protein
MEFMKEKEKSKQTNKQTETGLFLCFHILSRKTLHMSDLSLTATHSLLLCPPL